MVLVDQQCTVLINFFRASKSTTSASTSFARGSQLRLCRNSTGSSIVEAGREEIRRSNPTINTAQFFRDQSRPFTQQLSFYLLFLRFSIGLG